MDTFFLSAFSVEILNTFSSCFKNKQSFQNFMTLCLGWILTPGRKTIPRIIQAAGATSKKHHSCLYNFFSLAKWEIGDLSERVLRMIIRTFVHKRNIIYTVGDDTLYAKTGHKIPGTGMFRDPVLSTRKITVFRWGQNWVILGIILKLPFFNE